MEVAVALDVLAAVSHIAHLHRRQRVTTTDRVGQALVLLPLLYPSPARISIFASAALAPPLYTHHAHHGLLAPDYKLVDVTTLHLFRPRKSQSIVPGSACAEDIVAQLPPLSHCHYPSASLLLDSAL